MKGDTGTARPTRFGVDGERNSSKQQSPTFRIHASALTRLFAVLVAITDRANDDPARPAALNRTSEARE